MTYRQSKRRYDNKIEPVNEIQYLDGLTISFVKSKEQAAEEPSLHELMEIQSTLNSLIEHHTEVVVNA